ncbi:hypothetical protein J4N45_23380 [Vibrio sp. SCSIO 43140]|uniref:hypothetical protein n=1 Tax=Vibrio sp. SCSIO 43140 TaxID=2819100 RepID=UPI002074E64A|nr:hypothetical protein [Vibrio sp. SCSIO 43140]USD62319.1 hypothetical protein J4N45_23380 [Vibrio sp. SCSIO 43140]
MVISLIIILYTGIALFLGNEEQKIRHTMTERVNRSEGNSLFDTVVTKLSGS